jgi:hypothetical protein
MPRRGEDTSLRYQDHLRAISAEYEADYGFGLPWCIPDYIPSAFGKWKLSGRPGGLTQSYLAEHHVDRPHHILSRDGETWMASSMLELESHAWHLSQAKGTVLVAGLGMGMFVHAAASKDDVDRVVVLEIDPEVIEIFRMSSGFDGWPTRHKIAVINADALDPSSGPSVSSALGGHRPDYLYADIWAEFPNEQAPGQTRAMCALHDPLAAGWWGQEIEYGMWLENNSENASVQSLRTFFSSHRIPTSISEGYADFCEAAVRTQLYQHNPDQGRAPMFGM